MDKLEYIKYFHENRKLVLEKLEQAKEARKNIPQNFKKPCVFIAGVTSAPRTRANPNPKPKIEVSVFNVQGNAKKPETIRNLMRVGKFPIGYDLPGTKEIETLKKIAEDYDGVVSGDLYRATQGNPYAEFRRYLDDTIRLTLDAWALSDREEEISELKKRQQELIDENTKLSKKGKSEDK